MHKTAKPYQLAGAICSKKFREVQDEYHNVVQELAQHECRDKEYFYHQYNGKPIEHGTLLYGLIHYFMGNEKEAAKYKLDVRKSLRITGNTGTGKTMMMRIFNELAVGHSFQVKNCLDIVEAYNAEGEAIIKYTARRVVMDGHRLVRLGHLLLDDVGKERLGGHFQKKDRNIVGEIIDRSYDLWIRHGLYTHMTDNLTNDELYQIYGGRVAERILQMTNHVFLGAKEDSVCFRTD